MNLAPEQAPRPTKAVAGTTEQDDWDLGEVSEENQGDPNLNVCESCQ